MAQAKKKDLGTMALAELRTLANDLAEASNKAFEEKKFQKAFELSKELEEVVAQYAATKKDEVFTALKNSKDPMIEALKQLRYEVIAVKESVPEGKSYKEKTIETREKAIGLVALDKFCGGGIGKHPEWFSAVKFFAACMVIRKKTENGDEVASIKATKAYTNVSAEIKEFVLHGMDEYEAFTVGLPDTINRIAELMVGKKYAKVNESYTSFLETCSFKKGRGVLTLSAATEKVLTEVLAEILHGIILGKTVTIEHRIK